jgi:hypothetical protein
MLHASTFDRAACDDQLNSGYGPTLMNAVRKSATAAERQAAGQRKFAKTFC